MIQELLITAYSIDDEYMVDIVSKNNIYEAWIYHKSNGIKIMALRIGGISYKNFLNVVEFNFDTWKEDYKEYMMIR